MAEDVNFLQLGVWRGPGTVKVKKNAKHPPAWKWDNLGEALTEKGYAVAIPRITWSVAGPKSKQWVGVQPDADIHYAVCRANSWRDYHRVGEGGAPYFGQYWARFSSFAFKHRRVNNLMVVLRPIDGRVTVLEFGIRSLKGKIIATAQMVDRSIMDERHDGFLGFNHGLRGLLQEAWPDLGVGYQKLESPSGAESQIPEALLEMLTGKIKIKVVWHSLRLGLIKASLKNGATVFFDDRMLFRKAEDIKLLRKGRALIYFPPKTVEQGQRLFRMLGDYLAVERGKLIKPMPAPPKEQG